MVGKRRQNWGEEVDCIERPPTWAKKGPPALAGMRAQAHKCPFNRMGEGSWTVKARSRRGHRADAHASVLCPRGCKPGTNLSQKCVQTDIEWKQFGDASVGWPIVCVRLGLNIHTRTKWVTTLKLALHFDGWDMESHRVRCTYTYMRSSR